MLDYISNAEFSSHPAFIKVYRVGAGGDLTITETGNVNNTYQDDSSLLFTIPTIAIIDNIGNLSKENEITFTVESEVNNVTQFDSSLDIEFTCEEVVESAFNIGFD